MASFADVQYWIYTYKVGGVQKDQNNADVIWGWSLWKFCNYWLHHIFTRLWVPNVILECWIQWFSSNLDQQTNLYCKLLVNRRLKFFYNLYKTQMRLHQIFKVIMAMFLRDWRTPIWSVKRVYLMRRANGTVWYTF